MTLQDAAALTMEPTIGRQVLRALIDGIERTGVARDELMRVLGVEEPDLSLSGPRLTVREFSVICERALTWLDDPALGLRWGANLDERAFGAISHMLAHTGTLRRAFELLARFETLLCDVRSYEVVEDASTMSIRVLQLSFVSPKLARFNAEMLLSGMLTMVRGMFVGIQPRAVRFSFREPPFRAEYERVFGPNLLFEQACTELVFDRELLDRQSPHSDGDMHSAIKSVAEQQLVRLTRSAPYVVRLREHLLACWPERPDMETAARTLGLSIRSLRRQLTQEGTSYREVEYGALAAVAKRLLCEQNLTIQETAHEMGFSDAATFHRAFKTWTGLTPSAFRDR